MTSIEITSQAVPRRAEGALEAEVDGELVLLAPADLGFFGTAEVGERIWRLLDGSRSVDDLIAELEATYDDPEGVIRTDTLHYLEALYAAGLIKV